ncbi:hypothetical protein VULLAG_LOCUS18782 [Vulpes lagopus]
MATSEKGQRGTHPRYPRKEVQLDEWPYGSRSSSKLLSPNISVWPVSPFVLPWPRLPSYVLPPTFPCSLCGLSFRVRITITIFSSSKASERSLFSTPSPNQLYKWGKLYPRSHSSKLTELKFRCSAFQIS